jgi:hypothetical protein
MIQAFEEHATIIPCNVPMVPNVQKVQNSSTSGSRCVEKIIRDMQTQSTQKLRINVLYNQNGDIAAAR